MLESKMAEPSLKQIIELIATAARSSHEAITAKTNTIDPEDALWQESLDQLLAEEEQQLAEEMYA